MEKSHCERILIIRFSSLGDIIQCSPVPTLLRRQFPKARIVWLTREDFRDIATIVEGVDEVWTIPRSKNPLGLLRIFFRIANQFSHVYDAHNNLRSNLLMFGLRLSLVFGSGTQLLQRSKERWKRFLFFKLRRPVFIMPFRGSVSYIKPLEKWNIPSDDIIRLPATLKPASVPAHTNLKIALVPGAAWSKKIWPVEAMRKLVEDWPTAEFIILGGKSDDICFELHRLLPTRTQNFAGQLTLSQSVEKLQTCDLVIGNDTGLLHAADHLGLRSVFLIGPSAFGYPLRQTSRVAEVQLECKPCSKDGRGGCVNSVYQKCLKDIKSSDVRRLAQELLENQP